MTTENLFTEMTRFKIYLRSFLRISCCETHPQVLSPGQLSQCFKYYLQPHQKKLSNFIPGCEPSVVVSSSFLAKCQARGRSTCEFERFWNWQRPFSRSPKFWPIMFHGREMSSCQQIILRTKDTSEVIYSHIIPPQTYPL